MTGSVPKWDEVAYRTFRFPVEGGWLYRLDNLAMVFVPHTMREERELIEKAFLKNREGNAA